MRIHAHGDDRPDCALPHGAGINIGRPLVLVPLVILDFLAFTFPDGNGRMARLPTLQLLYHLTLTTVGRFISLGASSKKPRATTNAGASSRAGDGRHDIAPGWTTSGHCCGASKEFETCRHH